MMTAPRFTRSYVSVAELAQALEVSIGTVHYHINVEDFVCPDKIGSAYMFEKNVAETIVRNWTLYGVWSDEG